MGALVTLDLPDDSPVLALPWIVTFGPLDDSDDWEPVVCGPYERAHALSIAETVVADEELMAVVEPLQPHTAVDEIRGEIERAKAYVDDEEAGEYDPESDAHHDHDHDGDDAEFAEFNEEDFEELEEVEPTPAPSPEEVRAGFARIAARLTTAGL